MRLIHVTPISRGIGKEHFSYFSTEDVGEGSIVRVPLRKNVISALVVGSEDVLDAKEALKNAPFPIRKVERAPSISLVSKEFVEAVKDTARYFAGTTGAVFWSLVPNTILESAEVITEESGKAYEKKIRQSLVLQEDDPERFAHYKSFIREKFAKKLSVFLCLPTVEEINRARFLLEKGIENYTYVFHGGLTKKETIEQWNKVLEETHSVLVISTGSFLCIPRKDIGAIIIEKENTKAYKSQTRPYVDIRVFAEILSKKIHADIILGDSFLRTETLFNFYQGKYVDYAPLTFRSLSTATSRIVDMKKYKDKGRFRVLSDELIALIEKNRENNEHLFIFSARKGLSPTTICADCESTVRCTKCEAPLVLYGKPEARYFMCHQCGEKSSAERTCAVCTSWRLTTLGIGIERVEEEITKLYPDIKLFRMDKECITTRKQALKLIEQFNKFPGSILLGTELALLYIDRKVENSAVASMDSLLSVPDFRIQEKIFTLILRIRSLSEKNFLLQTRNVDQELFDFGVKGNTIDFYRSEVAQRKQFDYPPEKLLIKITCEGKKDAIIEEMNRLIDYFLPHTLEVFPSFARKGKDKYAIHGIIRLIPKEWVDETLLKKLTELPMSCAVDVDPESIL